MIGGSVTARIAVLLSYIIITPIGMCSIFVYLCKYIILTFMYKFSALLYICNVLILHFLFI